MQLRALCAAARSAAFGKWGGKQEEQRSSAVLPWLLLRTVFLFCLRFGCFAAVCLLLLRSS